MKTICLYFEIHQIIHLKRYRFFDIGTDHYYYDDYENERSITDIAERSYMPALNTLLEMIKENGDYFKVAFSLSGVGIEQLELHAPQVLEKLQELNATGCVEFLAEPYSHGLSALKNEESFAADVKKQCKKMHEYFGKEPKVLRNSSLIYSDDIGLQAAQMGFVGMLTEGAKHVLGWKSPHYVYNCALAPNLKLLLRDVNLSDDISLRFNNSDWPGYPLFADNYINNIAALPDEEQNINIFMELSALGIAQPLSSNILDFLRALPVCAKMKDIAFATPTEIFNSTNSVGALDVPDTLSWVDEERDVSCWLGNPMQREAFEKLYSIADRVRIANDSRINYETVGRSDEQIKEQYKADAAQLSADELLYAATLTNDANEKEAIYKKAAECYDKDYRAYNNLAVMAFNKGDENAAKCYVKQAFAKNQKAPEGYANLALIALRNGNIAEAESNLSKAINANGFGEVLGNLNIAKGNYATAVKNFEGSKSNSAALAQILNKDYAAAVATLKDQKNADALSDYLMAIVQNRQGNTAAAQDYLNSAIKKNSALSQYADNDLEFANLKK